MGKNDGKGAANDKTDQHSEFKEASKQSAENMYAAINEVKADPGYSGLSGDTKKRLDELLAELEKTKADNTGGSQSQ